MNGILIINKDKDYTSRDVVNKLNKLLNTKKIGHTGTLDPIARGVLVITIGKYTKLCNLLTSNYKEYIATIKLGIKTDTLDITGNILEKRECNIKESNIMKVLNSFKGKSIQEVPIYSAVKVNGKKLYEYARSNEKVILPKREIDIKEIELLSYKDNLITFKCLVSKGTYIRSLINDICNKLNIIGTMSDLIRTKQGIFKIEDAYTLEDIKNNNYKLLSIEEAIPNIDIINIDENLYNKIKNGSIIDKNFNKELCLYKYNNREIALYKEYQDSKAKPYIMLL